MADMTKAERADLRTLVRKRIRLLRRDVETREAELRAELEQEIDRKFAAAEKAWSDIVFSIDEAAREANRRANDILRAAHPDLYTDPTSEFQIVRAAQINRPHGKDRTALRREGLATIDAKVKAALAKLDRVEYDLEATLLVDGLETDAAREFLARIPTVADLVPADRLLAIDSTP